MPTSITMFFNAPKILPRTYGYSSLKHSFKLSPSRPNLTYYPQAFMQLAILATKSAACCLILIDLLFNLQ